jgi:hypothetical protein
MSELKWKKVDFKIGIIDITAAGQGAFAGFNPSIHFGTNEDHPND